MRHLRHQADGAHDRRGDRQRLRVFGKLGLDLAADILAGSHPCHHQAGGDGNGERGDLRRQAIPHRQQRIGARRIGQRQPVLQRADDQSADHVDDQDDHGRHHVPADEFGGAVHRAEKIRLAAQRVAAPLGGLRAEDAGIDLGIDRHLPAGQGVQHEAGGNLGDAAGALGDDNEIDDDENDEDDAADEVIAADRELAEGFDDTPGRTWPGIAVEQNRARGGDVQRQAHQRRGQQHGGEGGKFRRRGDVEAGA